MRTFPVICLVCLLLAGFILVIGCGEFRQDDPVIARVSKRDLTDGEVTQALVQMHLDPGDELLRTQYINSWVDRQLLLHEAQEQGIDQSREFRKALQDLREELIINQLLATVNDSTTVSEAAVINYWRDHTDEFKRPTMEVRTIVCSSDDRNTAWGIRNALDRSQEGDAILENYPGTQLDTTTWISPDRLPHKLAQSLTSLRTGQSSLPVEIDGNWYVIKLLDRSAAGETRPIDEVHDYIKSILKAETAELAQIDYINALRREARSEGLVQINMPPQNWGAQSESATVQDSVAASIDTTTSPEE